MVTKTVTCGSVFYYGAFNSTDRGNAARKEKIRYMMRGKQMELCVIDFTDEDINNIRERFHVLSDGKHGAAGRYEVDKLL